MPKLLALGTGNAKKRGELEALLALPALRLATLADFPPVPEAVEDADTFAGNAAVKARHYALALGAWCLAEDSGLCVDALAGVPGVCSARYAGEPCDDERNNERLLAALAGIPATRRGARYECWIAVADPAGAIRATASGKCLGRIGTERRGTGGFGYDPLFVFGAGDRTFAELPAAFKREHSHRAAAVVQLRPLLAELLLAPDWPEEAAG